MAKVDFPDMNTLPEKVHKLLEREPQLNIFKTMAHTENIAVAFARLGFQINANGELDPLLREIAILRVGFISGAGYEVHHHKRICKSYGMSDEKIVAIENNKDSPLFNDLEKKVIDFTDQIVSNVKADQEIFSALNRELTLRQVMELVITIGFYMMVCRFLENYEVDIEEEL